MRPDGSTSDSGRRTPMRIAVAAEEGTGLDRPVSAHFGRCPGFIIAEIQDGRLTGFDVVSNPFYGQHRPGQVPAFIREQGAEVLISGGMGGRAIGFFREFGIEPVSGAVGTVADAVSAYLAGERSGADPCRESIEHGHGQESGLEEGREGGRRGHRGHRRRDAP